MRLTIRFCVLPALLWVIMSACSSPTSSEFPGANLHRSVLIDGENRNFLLHIPKGVDTNGAGLILAFHGYGGSGVGFQRSTDLDKIARDLGVIIAYPNAGRPYWAEDCDCVPADQVHLVADTAFVTAMIDELTSEFQLNTSRRFAVGFSQGGLFSQRLACQMADRFEAIVEVASTMAIPSLIV